MKPILGNVLNGKATGQIKIMKYTDLDYLIQRTKNNSGMMMEMISAYLEQTPPLIKAMKQGLQDQDWDTLHAAVHKMIPSFAIVGMHADFEGIAKKIQEFARSQEQLDSISSLVSQLEDVCTQACEELAEELTRYKNGAHGK